MRGRVPAVRVRPWVLTAALVLVTVSALGQNPGDLARGRAAVEAGRGDEARAALEPLARGDDPRDAGSAWFFLGELAEHEGRFGDALAAYDASAARDPGGRYAGRSLARAGFLRARAEGGFVPLGVLERVRGSERLASDPTALADLLQKARGFPPGIVRAEAMLLVGQAYAGRLNRPDDAAPVLRDLAADPAAPGDVRRLAVQLLAQSRERTGEVAQGLAEVRSLGGNEEEIARLRELVRRERLYRASLVAVTLVVLAGVISCVRVLRAGRARVLLAALRRPLPLAHLAMLSFGGALLAHTYEDHEMSPFFALGAGALVVYASASAWSVAGSVRPWARVLRAVACTAAMLGASFLAMHRFDPAMLEGIGL